jgi:proteasome alpha subunit
MQFYASPEQMMRDRSEYARKNIARGRNTIVLSYEGGVLFVAENVSNTLHKVGEIYDRIGFAAVGRYNEFENLRRAGVRMADLNGYSYARRDVTGRALAGAYTQTLGAIFTDQQKPFEVEICVAEVGATPELDELYRITYDGSVSDEPGRIAMGGQADTIATGLRQKHRIDMSLEEALRAAVEALNSVGGEGGQPRTLGANQLEVAVLDRNRSGRTFRRIIGAALTALLERDSTPAAPEAGPEATEAADAPGGAEAATGDKPAEPAAGTDKPGTDKPGTDKPGTDKPGTDKPGNGKATGDKPNGSTSS